MPPGASGARALEEGVLSRPRPSWAKEPCFGKHISHLGLLGMISCMKGAGYHALNSMFLMEFVPAQILRKITVDSVVGRTNSRTETEGLVGLAFNILSSFFTESSHI